MRHFYGLDSARQMLGSQEYDVYTRLKTHIVRFIATHAVGAAGGRPRPAPAAGTSVMLPVAASARAARSADGATPAPGAASIRARGAPRQTGSRRLRPPRSRLESRAGPGLGRASA